MRLREVSRQHAASLHLCYVCLPLYVMYNTVRTGMGYRKSVPVCGRVGGVDSVRSGMHKLALAMSDAFMV